MRIRLPSLAAIAVAALSLPAAASAQTDDTWSGATSTSAAGAYDWSNGSNWVGNAPPTTPPVGTLFFPALTASACASVPYNEACYGSGNDLTGVSATGLSIDDGEPYDIYGNAITVGSGGIAAAPSSSDTGMGVPALELPITLGASQTWSIAGGTSHAAALHVGAPVSGTGSSLAVAFTAGTFTPYLALDDNVEVGDVTASGPGSILLTTSSSALDATDGHTVGFSGGANLQSNPGTTGSLTMSAGQITVGGVGATGNTLAVKGGLTLDSASTLSMFINNSAPAGAGTGYSQLSATSNVSLGGATLTLTGYGAGNTCPSYTPGDVDTLVTTSRTLSGTFKNIPDGGTITLLCPSGTFPSFRINYTTNAVTATALASTTTALAAVPSSPVTNQPVTLTATVSAGSGTPAGTVSFENHGTPISGCGSQPVALNPTSSTYTATCQVAFDASTSPEVLTAAFTPSPSSNLAPSDTTASPDVLTVNPDNTTTTLGLSSATPAAGSNVTYTAMVTPADSGPVEPSGTVEFFDGTSPISACTNQPLTAGASSSTATCTLSYPSAGSHLITAIFLPDDGSFNSSTSPSQTVTVQGPTIPPSKPVSSVAPAISKRVGPLYVGLLLGATTGTWSGSRPITYAYEWIRCNPACAVIPGATDSSYNVVPADAGARLMVVVTAANSLGSAQATSDLVGPVVPSVQQMQAAVSRVLVPNGSGARITALLAAGGFSYTFTAPGAGTLLLDWYYVPNGARIARTATPVLVASGRATFKKPGTATVKVRLTRPGRRMLRRARTLRLTIQATFTPTGAPAVRLTQTFRLRRR